LLSTTFFAAVLAWSLPTGAPRKNSDRGYRLCDTPSIKGTHDAHIEKGKPMNVIRAAITAVIVAFLAAVLLPMLGACGQKAAADENAGNVTTLRFFEHDTQQTNLDLRPEEGPGDLFDHPGGTKVGRTAGQCTALSGNAAAGDLLCTQTFLLEGGQITIQGLADRAAVFGRGETVPFAIVGGSGIYSNARGDGTIQVPIDVPNETDANFVLNVITG
jgi:Allene oxide cyclase barrel like domain